MRFPSPSKSGMTPPPEGGGDPWAAFGYLVAGVGAYGLIGWGLSVWLHASYLIPVGILVGAALGLGRVFYAYRMRPEDDPNEKAQSTTHNPSSTNPDPEAITPPGDESKDRGANE